MTDQNLTFYPSSSPDFALDLLSKSSPSQLQQHKRTTTRTSDSSFFQNNNKSNHYSIPNNMIKLSNLSHVPCKFYKQGTCTAGTNCTFSHNSDLSSEAAVCKYFIKGNCKFGTKCALLHTMSSYNRYLLSTSPPPIIRKKTNTADQIMMPNAFSPHQQHSYLHDFATGTSAPPAISFFQNFHAAATQHHPNNTNTGLLPRETSTHDPSLYNNNNHRLSSSVRNSSTFYPNNDYFLNDSSVMLPSSLNDLFTPTNDLGGGRGNQQRQPSYYHDQFSTLTNNSSRISHWKASSSIKKPSSTLDDEIDRLIEGTAAINIPNNNSSVSDGSSGGSSSYLFSPPEDPICKLPSFYPQQEDEEVQFFMEEIINDHEIHDNKSNHNTPYAFPSLVSLPSI
ncbi:uncharacterized protein BX663DRAFT_509778 [Cokeromyces recurvatus]|uniref:uncharacterized protein n=1 Tax=Cokeromyces recurvatus TaxID=90255 RepID=UPI00221E8623|nr:uncharacterized protein BX663DRAFT_509778 [Cokeromyces recurvatus]KAI7902594.1 hypothetical protein BX663DRAFT_509778 [Cokeromyces recurvatus]